MHVCWGELDFLVLDTPPGTSDENISIVQFLQATGIDGAIIVTTPQQVSLIDVRKEVTFCKRVGLPVLGVVENMSGLCQVPTLVLVQIHERDRDWRTKRHDAICSPVQERESVGSAGGGAKMCIDMGVPFLGKVPLDPQLCKAAEEGRSCFDDGNSCLSAPALKGIIEKLLSVITTGGINNGEWSLGLNSCRKRYGVTKFCFSILNFLDIRLYEL